MIFSMFYIVVFLYTLFSYFLITNILTIYNSVIVELYWTIIIFHKIHSEYH